MPRRDDSAELEPFLGVTIPQHMSYEIAFRTNVVRPGVPVEGDNGATVWSSFMLSDSSGRRVLDLSNPPYDLGDAASLMLRILKYFEKNPEASKV